MTAKVIKALFDNEYARIAFAHHASMAIDEMEELTADFYTLKNKSNFDSPNFNKLSVFVKKYKEGIKSNE
jgi:hypothetical protein